MPTSTPAQTPASPGSETASHSALLGRIAALEQAFRHQVTCPSCEYETPSDLSADPTGDTLVTCQVCTTDFWVSLYPAVTMG